MPGNFLLAQKESGVEGSPSFEFGAPNGQFVIVLSTCPHNQRNMCLSVFRSSIDPAFTREKIVPTKGKMGKWFQHVPQLNSARASYMTHRPRQMFHRT